MNPPRRFGHADVTWSPSVTHDPRQVIAAWLQHQVVRAVRAKAGAMSVREMAARAGVHKSTMGRWLAGQEVLNLAGIGTLAGTFGLDILDALASESDDPSSLLPEPYRPLACFRDGQLTFAGREEPAWAQLAAAMAAVIVDAEGDGSAHLLSASTLAWAVARSAHALAPTRGLVDLTPVDASIVTLGLEQPVTICVTLVPDGSSGQVRRSVLGPLRGSRAEPANSGRHVAALALGERGIQILDQVLTRTHDAAATVSATTLARAGIGDPIDADVTVVQLAGADAASWRVLLLELVKAPAD